MLVFVDESGYPRPTDTTVNPVLLGVCIHESDIKAITNYIYKLKDSLYGKQDEIKSTNVIREATILKNRTINKAYAEGIVDIVSKYNVVVFAIIMEKPDKAIITPDQHLPKQYYLLQKKIEFYCRSHNLGKAIMIFDEIHEGVDRKIAEAFTGFLFRTNLGRSFENLLEMPLFVSSAVTPAIQIADIYAGIVRHCYERGLDHNQAKTEYEEWIKKLFDNIISHTENNQVPGTEFIEYGFQRMKNHEYHIGENSVLTNSE